MPTGISGLYKGTKGAKDAARRKYEKEIKALAKLWNISLERAFETIMKRIDKGLPPLPATKKIASTPLPEGSPFAEQAKKMLESCVRSDIAEAAAGKHYDFPQPVKEAIELIEQLMDRQNIPRRPAFMIGQALRYIMRCGVKTEDWGADIAKAENYLHRALTGEWNEKAK